MKRSRETVENILRCMRKHYHSLQNELADKMMELDAEKRSDTTDIYLQYEEATDCLVLKEFCHEEWYSEREDETMLFLYEDKPHSETILDSVAPTKDLYDVLQALHMSEQELKANAFALYDLNDDEIDERALWKYVTSSKVMMERLREGYREKQRQNAESYLNRADTYLRYKLESLEREMEMRM